MDGIDHNTGLMETALGDGRPPLFFVALGLVLSGGFAIFLALTGHFLPHDIAYLGLDAAELCTYYDCRIVDFMIHDRTAFGGALAAVGCLYLWLIAYPLSSREPWAWWALVLSGLVGFGSFLTYLEYGYLDTWHGLATLILLPLFAAGLARSWRTLDRPASIGVLRRPAVPFDLRTRGGAGRALILLVTFGMVVAGSVILTIGISEIFVPQDLTFMQLAVEDLHELNERLVSLIAHDRAGFGGAIFSTGIAAGLAVWCGRPSRSLWQILFLAGLLGFGFAIGTHYHVGYIDFTHLAPAFLGAALFALGLVLSYPEMAGRSARSEASPRSAT